MPPSLAGRRPRVFANGVPGNARHLANLHMSVLPGLGQFDGKVQAFSLAQRLLLLVDGAADEFFDWRRLERMATT